METLFVFLNVQFVNLATYRQFTNAAWDWIIKKKKTKTKTETETKQNKIQKNFKIALSLGYPSSYFYNKTDVICCTNGYNDHFLDYRTLLLFVNANVIDHV